MATQKIPQFQFKFGYPEIPWGNFFRFNLEMGIYWQDMLIYVFMLTSLTQCWSVQVLRQEIL